MSLVSDNFTLSFWVKRTSNDVWFAVASTKSQTNIGIKNGKLTLSSDSEDRIGSTTIELNKWTHCVFSFEGNTLAWYINGVEDTVSSGDSASLEAWIAKYKTGNNKIIGSGYTVGK